MLRTAKHMVARQQKFIASGVQRAIKQVLQAPYQAGNHKFTFT